MARAAGIEHVVVQIVAELGPERSLHLASLLETAPSDADPAARNAVVHQITGIEQRAALNRLLQHVSSNDLPLTSLALALRCAALAAEGRRDAETVELVWTGPIAGQACFRDTEQALLQLVGLARRRMTLCTFAAYRMTTVAHALQAALARGVVIELILETPSSSGGKNEFDPANAFERDLLVQFQMFVWPRDRRAEDGQGRRGSLHAKFALADASALFLSSANLTEYALRLNMELGALIKGGPLPSRLRDHLGCLVNGGYLVCRQKPGKSSD